MDKKFFRYLLKTTSFSVPSSSNNHHKAHFSGTLVPKEARHKNTESQTSELQEPTSPKVSCIGTVKKKKKKKKSSSKTKEAKQQQQQQQQRTSEAKKPMVRRMLTMQVKGVKEQVVPERGVMRKFASGRETLRDFDWRTAMEDDDEDVDREEDFKVAQSGPILLGGGAVGAEKRREVNLWKRRASMPPVPLQLKEG